MRYFKHSNYYKINNKPILYIHHPFLIPENKLELFERILNDACKKNGFDGSILVLNNLSSNYKNFHNYNFHPNYKKSNTLNYNEYIDKYVKAHNDHEDKEDETDTIFFNFNNSARLCHPNKLQLASVYTNNSIYQQDKYIQKIFKKYENKDIKDEHDKILLINSWNEWGENMAIEPGEYNGYKYLLLLKSNLLSFL
jgi:hypothetical protein